MIEKMQLSEAVKDASIIEAIRVNMPVATLGKAGLADKNLLLSFNCKAAELKNGEKLLLGRVTGLLVISNTMVSHIPYIYQCSNFIKKVDLIHQIESGNPGFTFEWSSDTTGYNNELYVVCRYSNPDIRCYIRAFFQSM